LLNPNLNAPPFFNLKAEGFSGVKNASAKAKPQIPKFERHSYKPVQSYDEVESATPSVLRDVR